MKIRQRRNGGFVMEHNGVEAPYTVLRTEEGIGFGKWSVFDIEDEECESPIVDSVSMRDAEKAALAHFMRQ